MCFPTSTQGWRPSRDVPQFCVEVTAMSVFGPSYRRHIFDPLSKIPCEVATNAKSIGMIFAIFLLIIPILACTAGSGTGSSSGVRGGSSAPLTLLPDNTSRLEVLDVSTISGGGVPEGFETQFESQWEPYSLGDDIVTIDDVNSLVRAVTPDGEILMLSGSQIDFAGVRDWLTSEDANIEETSYQGQELWGGDERAMVLLQDDGYLVTGDTEALKELLKVKARGTGSLNQASDNSLKQAYDNARVGWYVLASENCDEFSSDLRACEAYSITGGQGAEDYLVDVTYRFLFRSEPRAEDQALDIEDWLDDTGWDIDLEEVQADGTSVEAKASGDEEDFRTEWLAGYRGVRTPAPLPTAVPDESSTSNGTNTARESGQTRAAPAAKNQEIVVPWPPGEPTMAPPQVDGPEASWNRLDSCLVELLSTGSLVGRWDGSCYSPRTGLQAHYYTFSLRHEASVTIVVSQNDAGAYRTSLSPRAEGYYGVSGQVVVLAGEGMDGEVLREDNYHYKDVLPAGTYTIEATHKNDGGEMFPVEYFELRFSVE